MKKNYKWTPHNRKEAIIILAENLSISINNPALERYIEHYRTLMKGQLIRAMKKLEKLEGISVKSFENKDTKTIIKINKAKKEFFTMLKTLKGKILKFFNKKE